MIPIEGYIAISGTTILVYIVVAGILYESQEYREEAFVWPIMLFTVWPIRIYKKVYGLIKNELNKQED